MQLKGAILVALACLLLSGIGGCGSSKKAGEAEQPKDPARALEKWFRNVEAEVATMEEKQRGFTHFHVAAQPPAKNDLATLSAAGLRAGELASNSANQLSRLTALSTEESRGLYCYFFAFYADLEFSPDRAEFEEVIFNLVKAELLPSTSSAEIHHSAAELREAMIQAEKATSPATKVAAGILC